MSIPFIAGMEVYTAPRGSHWRGLMRRGSESPLPYFHVLGAFEKGGDDDDDDERRRGFTRERGRDGDGADEAATAISAMVRGRAGPGERGRTRNAFAEREGGGGAEAKRRGSHEHAADEDDEVDDETSGGGGGGGGMPVKGEKGTRGGGGKGEAKNVGGGGGGMASSPITSGRNPNRCTSLGWAKGGGAGVAKPNCWKPAVKLGDKGAKTSLGPSSCDEAVSSPEV